MMKRKAWATVRASVFVLFTLLCFVLVAELGGWELVPTPKRKLESLWWPVLSDCASSMSEEQLTRLAERIPQGYWWLGEQRSGPVHQAGVLMLGDGQKVSFCFVSHHSLPCLDGDLCLDSVAICRVGDLEIRSIGCGCCEFGVYDWKERQPRDLIGFVRLLAECGKVEIVNRGPTPP